MMKSLWVWVISSVFLFYGPISAQTGLKNILFDDAEDKLVEKIMDLNYRTQAVAYNIANGTTPGFKPIRFQDEIDAAIRLYGDADILKEINIDDEMVKSTNLRLKHAAYVKLLVTKMGITKKVVSLGKGG